MGPQGPSLPSPPLGWSCSRDGAQVPEHAGGSTRLRPRLEHPGLNSCCGSCICHTPFLLSQATPRVGPFLYLELRLVSQATSLFDLHCSQQHGGDGSQGQDSSLGLSSLEPTAHCAPGAKARTNPMASLGHLGLLSPSGLVGRAQMWTGEQGIRNRQEGEEQLLPSTS